MGQRAATPTRNATTTRRYADLRTVYTAISRNSCATWHQERRDLAMNLQCGHWKVFRRYDEI